MRLQSPLQPAFVQQQVNDVEEVQARLTRDPASPMSPLDAALDLPPAEALVAIQDLADQHPEVSVYQNHLGQLHEHLMNSKAGEGLWDEALVHADESLRLGEDNPVRHNRAALLAMGADDFEGYRARCRAMFARYHSSKDPQVIGWVASAAAIRPGALDDYTELIEQVRRSVPLAGGVDGPAYPFILGIVLARAGQYPEAVRELEQVERFLESTGTRVNFSPTYYRFMLAICHAHLGHEEPARKWYEDATRDTRAYFQTNPGYTSATWNHALVLELLQEEAEAALGNLSTQQSRRESPHREAVVP